MKTKIILFTSLTLATIIFASPIIPYKNSKPPSLLLPDAYERATAALGTATNQFHCISANVATSFSSDGEWFFTFCSTNSKSKWVTVEFNGKTHVEDFILR
ncbi:MAG TPA: hypothetical protein VGH42_00420 [Verrucomicrobiae bacterium]|jgi:hypothetical protein